MARPLLRKFRNHDNWFRDNKHWFRKETRYETRLRETMNRLSNSEPRPKRRSYYRNEINDRVYDILVRGYGITNARKRELFPHVRAVLDGTITPSQAAYNFAMIRYEDDNL